MKKLLIVIIFLLGFFTIESCYYDNVEELYPQQSSCDTSNVTYSGTLAPMMQGSCNTCHSTTSPSGGVTTSTYDGLKTVALNGKLWNAVNRTQNWMPLGASKLPDCDLKKMDIWIRQGAPNN